MRAELVVWAIAVTFAMLVLLMALPGHAQGDMACVMESLSTVEAAMQDTYGEVRYFQHVFEDGSMHTWLLNAATETWSILASPADDTFTCLYEQGIGIENMPDRGAYDKVGMRL